ncbi:MAG: hypothetical protein IKT56_02975 [Clostridia bacterium]|nr:hypothetical protein [Clostridia bacterium]
MSQIFLNIINMSISASYIVVAVMLLRLMLKKAPKWITVLLWGIVAVRLICPFSLESVLSLIPSAEVVSPDIMMDRTPEIHTGITVVNSVVNPIISEKFTPDPTASANPLQIWIPIFTAIWLVGVISLLIYTIISYIRIRRKVGTAVLLRDNIYQSENVVSPFVLGLIKPKIFLPFHMNEKEMAHVVSHEQAHIRRKDHLWKPFGFLLLTLHWFNPLMWLGYILLCRDIELACDEKVIGVLGNEARADYSEALLSCSVNRRMVSACPLAFGEVGVKNRVKSVLSYKKPAFWIIIVAVISCIVVAVCFLTDPKEKIYGETDVANLNETQISLMEKYPEYFGLDATDGLDVYVWQMAPNSYYFGLLSHSKDSRYWLSDELLDMKGTNADEMRTILSTYDIDADDIYVIPWQNPLSSYIGEYWIIEEGEDNNAKKEEYVENIRKMLFDAYLIDIKEQDKCDIIYTSPVHSFVMDPSKVPNLEIENNIIYTVNYSLKERLGSVSETDLSYSDFYDLLHKADRAYYSEILKELINENKITYEVYPDTPQPIDLYYVMEQNNGDFIVVYGHYENESRENGIRWIYRIYDNLYNLTYDTAIFDIDNDGIDEICSMRHGMTSGIFTFIFDAREIGDEDSEYQAVFWSQWYDLSFKKGSDGITRVQGITQGENPEVHLFDISISDGNVNLTENGVPIGDVRKIKP